MLHRVDVASVNPDREMKPTPIVSVTAAAENRTGGYTIPDLDQDLLEIGNGGPKSIAMVDSDA